jgi:hypothetical protein
MGDILGGGEHETKSLVALRNPSPRDVPLLLLPKQRDIDHKRPFHLCGRGASVCSAEGKEFISYQLGNTFHL